MLRDFRDPLFVGPGAPFLAELRDGPATLACEHEAWLTAGVACAPDALPFADERFDLVVSLMSLHVVDDLPRALFEARRVLRPDGFFLALFPGERTLHELRAALRQGEAMATGGLSPRVSPMVAVRDAGGLLQRAGFALPVADTVSVPVTYRDPRRLLSDLRAMGEANASAAGPRGAMRRDVLAASLAAYGTTAREGRVTASFDLVALAGWAPDASQPKPLRPGSATASLADAVRNA